jgi:large subunit ribosomal protein L6
MVKIKKYNNKHCKSKIFLQTKFIKINIFFIDKTIYFKKIKLNNIQNKIIFNSNSYKNYLILNKHLNIFNNKNKLLLIFTDRNTNKKKAILNLYNKLIQTKLKECIQIFKLNLIFKGVGLKAFIKNENQLILKLGFSHNILINIPSNIQVILKPNKILFLSNNFNLLSEFVFFIKKLKKPEPFKGKGLFVNNETILLKEGKKK